LGFFGHDYIIEKTTLKINKNGREYSWKSNFLLIGFYEKKTG